MKRSTAGSDLDESKQNDDNESKRRRLSDVSDRSESSLLPENEKTDGTCPMYENDFSESHKGNSFSPQLSSAPPPPPLDNCCLEDSESFESPHCSSDDNLLHVSSSSSCRSYSFHEECPLCLSFEDPVPPKSGTVVSVHKQGSTSKADPLMKSNCDAKNLTTSLLRVKILEGHSDDVLCVAADESIVVSTSADTTIKIWDMTETKEICSLRGHTSSVTCSVLITAEQTEVLTKRLCLEETSRIVVSGSLDCTLRLWSLPSGQEVTSVYTFNGITCLQYLEHECYIIIATDGGKLELWDLCPLTLMYSVCGHEDLVSDMHVDGYNVYSASEDGTVKVWQVKEKSLLPLYSRKRKEVKVEGKERNVDDLAPCKWKAVRSFQELLYLGDNSGDLKILDWKAGKLKIQQNLMQSFAATDALYQYDNILVSSSFDNERCTGALTVWQIPEMKYICSMLGPMKHVYSLAVTHAEDGMLRIVSGGSQLIVWDFDFSQPCAEKDIFKDKVVEVYRTSKLHLICSYYVFENKYYESLKDLRC